MGIPLMIRLAVFTLALSFCYDVVYGHGNSQFDERGWARAGQFLTEHMDRSKAPCEHFYDHVCGKYSQEEYYEDGGGMRTTADDQNRITIGNVRALLERMAEGTEPVDPIEQLLVRFYRRCRSAQETTTGLDLTENVNAATNATVNELLLLLLSSGNASGGGGEQHRWRVIGRLWRDFGIPTLFPYQKKYIDYELDYFTLENGTLRIEITTGEEPAFPVEEQLVSFERLTSLVPSVDWPDYFEQVFGPSTTAGWLADPSRVVFAVSEPEALNEMGRNVNGMDSAQFGVLVGLLVGDFLQFELIKPKERGEDAEQLCLSNVMKHQSAALARVYLRSIGSSSSQLRHDILTVQRHVFPAFQFLLNSVDWLDERDKEKVHSKLDEMRFYPGIPDWIDDEDKVMESAKQYAYDEDPTAGFPFSAEIDWIRADRRRDLEQSHEREQEEEEEEDEIIFAPGAQYMKDANRVRMYLGLLLPPMFDIKYPAAVKYGGVGSIMAHELMHAFDAYRLPLPSQAHQNDWLSERAWKEFEKRKACLIKEYAKFCHPKHAFCINGTKNIEENMADVDGLKVAYTAFKFAKQVHGEDPPIPSMLNYTDDQLFFVANARQWCAPGWSTYWRFDVHSPMKARVDVTLANNPVFSRSFQCAVGSTYARTKACSVWGQLVNPAAARKRRNQQ